MKHGIPINWTYMILEHIASHDQNSEELPYTFFITKILQYLKVNLVKKDPMPMEYWEIIVHICYNKMSVVYNYKENTIRYLDDEVEKSSSSVSTTSSRDWRHETCFWFMAYIHHSISTKITNLYVHTQVPPSEISPYQYPSRQPQNAPPNNFNQIYPQDNFDQDFMNQN